MKTCTTCGDRISPRNTSGYCKRHISAAMAADPEWRAKQKAGIRRSMADPMRVETMRRLAKENGKSEGATEKRRLNAKRMKLWEFGHAALEGDTDARVRAGKRRTATVLAHIPREKRDEYRELVRTKKIPAVDAADMVLADHEAEMERWRRDIGRAA